MGDVGIVGAPWNMARGRWQHWVAATSVVAALALVAVTLLGLWRWANHDRAEVVDQPVVVYTSNAACTMMRQTVHRLMPPSDATVQQRVKAIRAQNDAVELMLQQIRRVGLERVNNDLPMPAWLGDWESLVNAREAYAAALAKRASRPLSLKVPLDEEGQSIVSRMNDVGLDCSVPAELLSN
ncbi:hypothetical protein SAMN05216199_0015 [Pedococcus cremeus]|uniref:Uncharacterized protein n=2 Tax=Pedococcus cremeus TaxID=587636 RepID=A0A1H9XP92_9MICO|nr:hypothetical protein SAMN05216199_0015 [Pedococcus cremeus]